MKVRCSQLETTYNKQQITNVKTTLFFKQLSLMNQKNFLHLLPSQAKRVSSKSEHVISRKQAVANGEGVPRAVLRERGVDKSWIIMA